MNDQGPGRSIPENTFRAYKGGSRVIYQHRKPPASEARNGCTTAFELVPSPTGISHIQEPFAAQSVLVAREIELRRVLNWLFEPYTYVL